MLMCDPFDFATQASHISWSGSPVMTLAASRDLRMENAEFSERDMVH